MGFILNTYTNIGTAKMDPPPPKRPITIPVKKAPKYPIDSKKLMSANLVHYKELQWDVMLFY
jgi:hypothetical protein